MVSKIVQNAMHLQVDAPMKNIVPFVQQEQRVKMVDVIHAKLGVTSMLKDKPSVLNARWANTKINQVKQNVKNATMGQCQVLPEERTKSNAVIVCRGSTKQQKDKLLALDVRLVKVNPNRERQRVFLVLPVHMVQVLD